jgi:hypothetical protein
MESDEKESIYRDFQDAVNMAPKELDSRLGADESIGRGVPTAHSRFRAAKYVSPVGEKRAGLDVRVRALRSDP